LSTVDRHGELVGLVVERSSNLSRSLLGVWEKTLSEDIEVAAISERVQSSSLNSDLLGLSCSKREEVCRAKSAQQKVQLDTLERNLGT
jgi:hypothetical protein